MCKEVINFAKRSLVPRAVQPSVATEDRGVLTAGTLNVLQVAEVADTGFCPQKSLTVRIPLEPCAFLLLLKCILAVGVLVPRLF